MDYEYSDKKIGWPQLENDSWIAKATLEQIQTAFTFLNRAEYWSGGSWKVALEKDVIVKLLHRLKI